MWVYIYMRADVERDDVEEKTAFGRDSRRKRTMAKVDASQCVERIEWVSEWETKKNKWEM